MDQAKLFCGGFFGEPFSGDILVLPLIYHANNKWSFIYLSIKTLLPHCIL